MMSASQMKRFLDKRNLPICQQAAAAFAPYFDQLGTARTSMAMLPLQTLYVLADGKTPARDVVEAAIRMGSAKSGIPMSVLRLQAECLFGPQFGEKPAQARETSRAGESK